MSLRLHAPRPHILLSQVPGKKSSCQSTRKLKPWHPLDSRSLSPVTRWRNRTLLRKAFHRHIRPPNRPRHLHSITPAFVLRFSHT